MYIHTASNVLIEVNPKCRIPRTFKRFAGLMGKEFLPYNRIHHGASLLQDPYVHGDLPHSSREGRLGSKISPLSFLCTDPLTANVFGSLPFPLCVARAVQLLHKLKVRSADGSETLLKVIKNPISRHLPAGFKCYGTVGHSRGGEGVFENISGRGLQAKWVWEAGARWTTQMSSPPFSIMPV